jgi:hypothetical protein
MINSRDRVCSSQPADRLRKDEATVSMGLSTSAMKFDTTSERVVEHSKGKWRPHIALRSRTNSSKSRIETRKLSTAISKRR